MRAVTVAALAVVASGCSFGNYDGSWDGSAYGYGDGGYVYGDGGVGFADAAPVTLTVPPEGGTVTSSDGVFSLHVPPKAYSTSISITITPRYGKGIDGTTAYDVSSPAPPPQMLVSAMYRLTGPEQSNSNNLALTATGQQPIFGGVQRNGNATVFYVVTHNPMGMFALGRYNVTMQTVPTPAPCLQTCCQGQVAQIAGNACACANSNIDAVQASTCLEQCSEALAQSQCMSGVQCNGGGPNVCQPGQGCCIGSPSTPMQQYCEGAPQNCQGTILQCNGASDCAPGQLCCLSVNGTTTTGAPRYAAKCETTTTCLYDQVCRSNTECPNCGYPGNGCAFNTCSRKSLPGVCQ